MTNWSTLLVETTIGILLLFTIATKHSEACNEAVCASVVSKCMLTQSCKCDMVTCNCCRECFSCLSTLYSECCSCVDLCPKPNVTNNPLSRTSHVADLDMPVPDLFRALTTPDQPSNWSIFTFPVDFDTTSKRAKELKEQMKIVEKELSHPLKPNTMTLNCTVAYMQDCMSWNKCNAVCQSMGSTSYRWFHDGCCECIGHMCINYGINESRCPRCPEDKEDDVNTKNADYGEEDEYLANEAEEVEEEETNEAEVD